MNLQLILSDIFAVDSGVFTKEITCLLTDLTKVKSYGRLIVQPATGSFSFENGKGLLKRPATSFSNQVVNYKKATISNVKTERTPAPSKQVTNIIGNTAIGSIGSVIFGQDGMGNSVCPLCQKKFPRKANAERHFQTAHGNVCFKCRMCDYNTSRKDSLKLHGIKKHGLTEEMAKLM